MLRREVQVCHYSKKPCSCLFGKFTECRSVSWQCNTLSIFFNNPTPTTCETLGVLIPASRTAKLAWALLPFPLKGKKNINWNSLKSHYPWPTTRSCETQARSLSLPGCDISFGVVLVGCYLLVKTSFKFFMNKRNLSKVNIIYRSQCFLAEWLVPWTCNSDVPSSSPALTASWICSPVVTSSNPRPRL